MALPSSTANWHWKNKNVTKWGQEWFDRELKNLTVKGDSEDESLTITSVTEVDGDIELGQRKSKLITIYDCKVSLQWEGKAKDGSEVKGRLEIPEVSHEVTVDKLSDYSYNWIITSSSTPAAQALVAMAKVRGPPVLEAVFDRFPVALIETHGKDLTVSADPSRSGTPAPPANANAASTTTPVASGSTQSASASVKKDESKAKAGNTTKVTVEASFMAAADDLFGLLTDEKRIPMWTRANAKSEAKSGTEYSLFGGGVTGKYVSLEPPTKIIQTWALQSPTWPSGHSGTLTTTLDQSSDSTKVTLTLEGVPLGQEDEIRRNIEGYYIHGLKSIGYVQLFPSPPSYSSVSSTRNTKKVKKSVSSKEDSSSTSTYLTVGLITCLVLVAAFAIPYLSSDVPRKRV
ncbi:Co-chaperone, variant 2 [Stygiomarasmius scandens]|uniref:Co-chaperone, variant 2 n=1 Tax=Marasmiellus scandens TaxID=2682957 RepID=A0ABR1JAG9_9AGAR